MYVCHLRRGLHFLIGVTCISRSSSSNFFILREVLFLASWLVIRCKGGCAGQQVYATAPPAARGGCVAQRGPTRLGLDAFRLSRVLGGRPVAAVLSAPCWNKSLQRLRGTCESGHWRLTSRVAGNGPAQRCPAGQKYINRCGRGRIWGRVAYDYYYRVLLGGVCRDAPLICYENRNKI